MTTLIISLLIVACAIGVGRCVRFFLPIRPGIRSLIPFVLFACTLIGPLWIGDENPLFLFVAYLLIFVLCYQGSRLARLVTGVLVYCLLLPFCAIIDTLHLRYALFGIRADWPTNLLKVGALLLLFLLLRKKLPSEPLTLPPSFWQLIGVLLLAPLFGILAFSITGVYWREIDYMREFYLHILEAMGFLLLPFVLVSAAAVLVAAILMSRHETLTQENRLAGLRELYYQSLQREQKQVRLLRHDMRNHLTTLSGLLERGDVDAARAYLAELTESPALRGTPRFCENEAANAVLACKATELAQAGLQADFSVSLPKRLAIRESDLIALLGNALDNACEAAQQTTCPRVTLRARVDKGLFMLRVVNAYAGERILTEGTFPSTKPKEQTQGLRTQKTGKTEWEKNKWNAHGFGLYGMRTLAERYGGTLQAEAKNGQFELVVCLPQRDETYQ